MKKRKIMSGNAVWGNLWAYLFKLAIENDLKTVALDKDVDSRRINGRPFKITLTIEMTPKRKVQRK